MDDYTRGQLKGHILLVTLILLFGLLVQTCLRVPSPYREEYSAYVIDKRVRFSESRGNEGGIIWTLYIGDLHGNEFYVRVSEKIYQQVQPGSFIEKKAGDKEPTIGR